MPEIQSVIIKIIFGILRLINQSVNITPCFFILFIQSSAFSQRSYNERCSSENFIYIRVFDWPQSGSYSLEYYDSLQPNPLEVKTLDLRCYQLDSVPKWVFECRNIERLFLSGNNISELPEEIGMLAELTEIEAFDNKISVIPESLLKLKKLKSLDLSFNELDSVPGFLGHMKGLNYIGLAGNNIGALPASFMKLDSLKVLYLSHNDFYQFPVVVFNIKNLEVLNLSHNHLSGDFVPESMNHWSIKSLYLDNNQFERFPENSQIFGSEALKSFTYFNNPVKVFDIDYWGYGNRTFYNQYTEMHAEYLGKHMNYLRQKIQTDSVRLIQYAHAGDSIKLLIEHSADSLSNLESTLSETNTKLNRQNDVLKKSEYQNSLKNKLLLLLGVLILLLILASAIFYRQKRTIMKTRQKLIQSEKDNLLINTVRNFAHMIRNSNHLIQKATENLVEETEYLMKHPEKPDKEYYAQKLKRIQDGSHEISSLVNIFHQRAREEEAEEIDYPDVLHTLVKLYEKQALEKQIKFEIDTGNIEKIKLSQSLLTNTLVNLIQNSIEHAFPEAGPENRIRILSEIQNNKFSICFEDNGKGVEEEELAKLFDPFYTSGNYGKGLGLYTVKKTLEAYGGTIHCKILNEGGLRFEIELR